MRLRFLGGFGPLGINEMRHSEAVTRMTTSLGVFWTVLRFLCVLAIVAVFEYHSIWAVLLLWAGAVAVRHALALQGFIEEGVVRFAVVVLVQTGVVVGAYQIGGIWGLLAILASIIVTQIGSSSQVVASLEAYMDRAKVLRGARVCVHSVTAAQPPEWSEPWYEESVTAGDFDTLEEFEEYRQEMEEIRQEESSWRTDRRIAEEQREHADWSRQWNWYCVEATVKPANHGDSDVPKWEPGELQVTTDDLGPVHDDGGGYESARIYSVEVWSDGEFRRAAYRHFEGAQRLRMLVGTKPGPARLRFCYSLDEQLFGELTLPDTKTPDLTDEDNDE